MQTPNQAQEQKTSKVNQKISHLAFIAIIVAVYAILKIVVFSISGQPSYASDLTAENILTAINRERSLRNLITLNTDNRLGSAAQSKTDDMIARHYFSHTDPEGNYIWPKIVAAGYTPYLQLGENLAIEFSSTDSLVSAWMNSPTHRANILNEGFKDQGMGLALGDVQINQYHSAVANTFGALLIKKTAAAAPVPAVQPVSSNPSPPKTSATVPPQTSAPTQTTEVPQTSTNTPLEASTSADSAKKASQPLAIRGDFDEPNFTTSEHYTQPSSSTSTAKYVKEESPVKSQSSALAGKLKFLNSLKINRYLSLGLGMAVLLLLLSDLKVAFEKRLGFLDKKINNLLLLILSLLVIAFMYWL